MLKCFAKYWVGNKSTVSLTYMQMSVKEFVCDLIYISNNQTLKTNKLYDLKTRSKPVKLAWKSTGMSSTKSEKVFDLPKSFNLNSAGRKHQIL